jgi:ferredoxin-NADP reductase
MEANETRLLRREVVADQTMAFWFARPEGFTFEAGQNATFSLLDPAEFDGFGPSRTFTIASAPHEPDLMVATRMRDTAFKRLLKTGPLGCRVGIEGPAGMMTLHEDASRPAVFIAGGIGITPFLSMARHAAHARLPHRIQLLYGNRRPEDAAFFDELAAMEKSNPNFRLVAIMSLMEKSQRPWSGEKGMMDRAFLARHLGDAKKAIYYLAGPPGMVMGVQTALGELGVADDDMRGEEFYGY